MKIKYYFIGIYTLLFLILVSSLLTYTFMDGKGEKYITGKIVSNYFAKNKIVFDEEIEEYYVHNLPYSLHNGQGNNYFDLDIEQFSELLSITYSNVTNRMDNPCQFYSYIWKEYLEYNNIEYRFVTMPKHIFILAYYKDKYILLDQFKMEETRFAP